MRNNVSSVDGAFPEDKLRKSHRLTGRDVRKRSVNQSRLVRGRPGRLPSFDMITRISNRHSASPDRDQDLGFLLNDVARLYARRFEQRAHELSLTLVQCRALTVLADRAGLNQTRLSQLIEINSARLVRVLDRIEADGWAVRRRNPLDRRARSLIITESAKPIVRRIWSIVSETDSEALRGLGGNELELLTLLLERVHANLLDLQPVVTDPANPGDAGSTAAGATGP